MTIRTVLLAPVPAIHLASTLELPNLSERVAFGSSKGGIEKLPIGIDVFIYATDQRHALFRKGVASWTGILGSIVPAVQRGPRSGKHPDRTVRPASAEETDGPFMNFWEVFGLRQLPSNGYVPLTAFRKPGRQRVKAFPGDVPEWPVMAELVSD
jgi:hypothetical protein